MHQNHINPYPSPPDEDDGSPSPSQVSFGGDTILPSLSLPLATVAASVSAKPKPAAQPILSDADPFTPDRGTAADFVVENKFAYSSRQLGLLRQPETGPISKEKLVRKVMGIYAGLVMVQTKCIEVIGKLASQQPRLNDEQWQSLIGLHRTVLHEHHDFCLASHHPSASPELHRPAAKLSIPTRMWRYGMHPFLELL